VKESWRVELEKEMKELAEELKKAELDNHQNREEETSEDYYDVLYVPYIAGFSERLQKELKPLQVGLAYKTGTTLFSRVCKLKPPREIDDQKDVVYHIPCKSCTACYIGETGQKFGSRRYQHEYDIKTKKKKNGIGDHMRDNKKHLVDWDDRTFLEVEKDWRRRRIKEALYIDSINPQEDIDPNKLMNPEKGTEVSKCWKQFYPNIREIFKEKISQKKPTCSGKNTSRSKPK